MNTPALSIVTITKDDPVGLADTLASTETWRTQSWVEQLVVSAGEAPSIRDNTVVVLPQTSSGIAGAFNEGWAKATGEWVWFLNGGDQVDVRLTPEFMLALLGASRAEMIVGGVTYEGEGEPRPHPPGIWQWPPLHSWIPHPATLVRRRLFEQLGGFDERYAIAMDHEWWWRVFSAKKAVDVITAPLAVFAPGGISQRPEMMNQIRAEQADALRRHHGTVWRPWLRMGYWMTRAMAKAVFARRLSKSIDRA